VRIPLDLYRILGIPQQTTEEFIEQAYQDRLVQLPRREFSDEAIAVRNQLLAIAYETLSDPDQRQAYDRQWWGEDATDDEAIPLSQPEFECEPFQLIGVLLILLDLGEYELVLEYGEPALNDPLGTVGDATYQADYLLCVTLAHWELSREWWQQQHYELAAVFSLKAFGRLQQENAFPDLQTTIRQDLYKLRPYRILELLTQTPTSPENLTDTSDGSPRQDRQKGLELLRDTIRDRGGIEGSGQDHSGLANDDFLKFIHQLRPHLTLDEQAAVFLPESRRPSRIASYLAIHTLIAQGIRDKFPRCVVEAKSLIAQLTNCQDLALENAVCDLLLGQTENLSGALDQVQESKAIATMDAEAEFAGEDNDDDSDVLLAFYGFTETWLAQEILPYFQGLTPDSLSLSPYFDDLSVQNQLENLLPDDSPPLDFFSPSHSLPSPDPEPETPMVHSSAAYADDYQPHPPAKRRGHGQRRSINHFRAANTNQSQGTTATLTPPAYTNGNGEIVEGNYHGTTVSPENYTDLAADAVMGASVPTAKRRRRKKRVKIDPIRFGVFLLCLAGVIGGSAFLIFRGMSPLGSLEAEQLDLSLNNASEFIPDESTQKTLLLSQGNFTQAVGQQVLQTWLDQKKLAFGEKQDLGALNTILVPNLLKQQQSRIQQDAAQNRYRQYEHQLKILNYTVNPRDPNQATVTARVQEITQFFPRGSTQAKGSPEKDDLTIRYQLVRQQGVWKIAQIQVVTVH